MKKIGSLQLWLVLKNYICGHIIHIALKKNMADYPLNSKNIPIGQKRKIQYTDFTEFL